MHRALQYEHMPHRRDADVAIRCDDLSIARATRGGPSQRVIDGVGVKADIDHSAAPLDALQVGDHACVVPATRPAVDANQPDGFTSGLVVNFFFGGTSLLIVVGVAMDTVQQVESQLIMRHYDGFMKKTRIRGRRG